MPARFTRFLSLTIITCATISLTGCTAITKTAKNAVPVENSAAVSQDSFRVEMHPTFGKPKAYTGFITKPTTVQNALEESGALSEFSAMTIDLYRKLPDGRPLKLPVEFKKGKQIRYDQDYSVHPNDQIIVRAKSNSPLDKFVDQVFGNL